MGDLVERLRSWSPSQCWHCGEWGCLNAAGHSTWCEGDCECDGHYGDTICPTPCSECGGDSVCVCDCHTDHSNEAAEEIERLRQWVTDLSSAVSSMRRDNWNKDQKIEALARRCEYLRRFAALEDLP